MTLSRKTNRRSNSRRRFVYRRTFYVIGSGLGLDGQNRHASCLQIGQEASSSTSDLCIKRSGMP